jgi:enoyl-CoA hydratase/carnithine racemase
MPFKYLLYEKKGRIAYVTLNRPEVMNSISPPVSEEMWEAFSDFRDDPEAWVLILTGAGEKAFSAGNDLKYQAQHASDPKAMEIKNPGGFAGITKNFTCYKPMIAAVNGFALGGGLEIALKCDIIIAADHARFGLPEPTVGLMAAAGGVLRLPRMIPQKIAMGMMFTARPISAQEAYRIGLVNEVVPLKDLMATAERWANDILRCSPLSIQATKEVTMKALDMTLEDALNTDFPVVYKLFTSEDAVEGPLAFAQKRPPQWKGR